jgi:arsenate reductase
MVKEKVLILCTGNSARSQMAEALLRNLAGDRFDVFSAGTHPDRLHPQAVKAMAEIGIDISTQSSKSVERFVHDQFDYVITVCDRARESCPVFPGVGHRMHHSFEDPAAAPAAEQPGRFREVRDQIGQWLQEFIRLQHRK